METVETRTKAPRQDRSRRTLERILDAAEEMLEASTFDDAPVAAIVARAGASVGSFYARFPDKEALLEALLERYNRNTASAFDSFAREKRWAGAALKPRVEGLVRLVVEECRRHRGLLRVRLLRSLAPGRGATALQLESGHTLVVAMTAFLRSARGEVRRRPVNDALRFALLLIDGVAASILVADDGQTGYGRMSDRRRIREIAAAVMAYLTTPLAS